MQSLMQINTWCWTDKPSPDSTDDPSSPTHISVTKAAFHKELGYSTLEYPLQLKCDVVANEPCTMRSRCNTVNFLQNHYDVIKWKHFRVTGHLCGEFTRHRWKGRWRGASKFSFICAWINGWVNNSEAGDLRRHRTHYDVTVITK